MNHSQKITIAQYRCAILLNLIETILDNVINQFMLIIFDKIARSYSDCVRSRRSLNNNLSPLSDRKNHINPTFGAPTRV